MIGQSDYFGSGFKTLNGSVTNTNLCSSHCFAALFNHGETRLTRRASPDKLIDNKTGSATQSFNKVHCSYKTGLCMSLTSFQIHLVI